MASLILPSRLTRQLQRNAPLNRGNQLGAKVIEHISLNGDRRATVSGAALTYGAGGSTQASAKGRSLRGTGTAARASVPLDLSKYSAITITFWLYWDVFANDDALAFEFTANGTAPGGFAFNPNSSGPAPGRIVAFGAYTGGTVFATSWERPSAGAWHRYALVFNGTGVAQLAIDGVIQAGAVEQSPAQSGTFSNSTLYLLSRANSNLFGTGNLQDVTFYKGVLSPAEVAQDYANPYQIFQAPARNTWAPVFAANNIAPPPGGITFSGSAPAIQQPLAVAPSSAIITVAGSAPSILQPQNIAPAAGNVMLTGAIPSLSQPKTVTPNSANTPLMGYAPAIGQTQAVSPAPAATALLGAAPTIGQGQSAAPASGAVAATGWAPTIAQIQTLAPGPAATTLTGFAPTVGQGQSAAPQPVLLSLSGYAPAVGQGQGAAPFPAGVVLTGFAPTVQQQRGIFPPAGQVNLIGIPPAIGQGQSVAPSPGTLNFSGPSPGVSQPRAVAPAPGAVLFFGFAPSISQEGAPITDIDARFVPPWRHVVFEGSRRVVSFEGSNRIVRFE